MCLWEPQYESVYPSGPNGEIYFTALIPNFHTGVTKRTVYIDVISCNGFLSPHLGIVTLASNKTMVQLLIYKIMRKLGLDVLFGWVIGFLCHFSLRPNKLNIQTLIHLKYSPIFPGGSPNLKTLAVLHFSKVFQVPSISVFAFSLFIHCN